MTTTTQKGAKKAQGKANALHADVLLTTNAPSTPVPIPDGFNANLRIINNSGMELMVLDGFASSETASEILYEQSLKVLTASDGSATIKKDTGATATYVLNDDYYDDDGKEWDYSYAYNLIIVRADNLFPIKIMGVLPNDDWDGYDDITVTSGTTTITGDWECMVESQAFQQNLMAYPDSLLSTQFANTCKDTTDNSDSDGDIDSKVNAFFAKTDSYKQVTLNSLTAIQTYWETFPYIWAGYAASKSYYLYSSDGTTVTYVGSLDITAPATSPAGIDKTLPGFSFSFTPADTSQGKKTLQYMQGQFIDSVETTTIALKGIYQLKSQFTNVATDNVIMAFMSGSVNGSKVIGYNEKLTKDSDGNWSGLYTMLHPKDAAGWMALILEAGAVIMTLELLSRPLKYLWDKYRESKSKNKGADPSKTEADKMRTEAKNKQTQDATEAQRTMDRMGTDITIKIDINFNNSASQLQTDRINRTTEDSRSNYLDITARQEASFRTLSNNSYGMDTNMEKITSEIKQNVTALDPAKTSTADLAGKLNDVSTRANSVHNLLPVEIIAKENKTTEMQKEALSEAQTANDDALKTQEQIDKSKDTSDKGDDGDVEMDDFPKAEE